MPKNRSHGTPEQFEQAVRQRIEELSGGVESTTAITADTDESGLFADPNGVIGDAGELYTYQELKKMYDDGIADGDQWFASYPTFEQWYRQIVLGYLTRVTSEDGLFDDDDEDLGPWEVLGTKQVQDSDGFWTDYTLWHNIETDQYVCIFGDSDLYNPENTSPDFETASEFEAYEWFNDYDTGELEGEDDIYDEIHSSTNPRRNPILGKDSGMENPSYVSLILDTIPYVLKDGGIADEVTKVGHADGNIVFTFKKDGDTYTARFPEHELTGRDHDDLPDDEWLIEDAARDAIAGINAATNTCGIAAKADTGLDNVPDEITVTIEGSTLDEIDECDNPIMSGSIPYGEYGQMLIDDEEELRDQYDEGELAPSEIVESLGYVAQDDHVYIKDLGDGCNMVFDFTKYDMDDNDECIQHYFTDETGRIPRGYTVTKMYL